MSEKFKILIAEDTADLRELMRDRLVFEGYEVVTAVDGQEAWDKTVADKPDVVLLDLMMPRLNGFEVLERLRQTPPAGRHIPVIIVSAKGELRDMRKGFQLEAEHYIVKPWEVADILQGVKKVLRLARHHKTPQDLNGGSFHEDGS